VAVDSSGNAYITGQTFSTDLNVKNAYDSNGSSSTNQEAFFAKINPSLTGSSSLIFSSYYGTSPTLAEIGNAIVVDDNSAFYIAGEDSANGFVAMFDSTGTTREFLTEFNGNGTDGILDIALENANHLVVSGYTYSSSGLTLTDATQSSYGGGEDAYVASLQADDGQVLFGTYLGGSGLDIGYSIAMDTTGGVYVSGQTASTDFTTGGTPYQTNNAGAEDTFLTHITGLNTAPVLDASQSPTLTAIDKNNFTSSGNTVASIIVDNSITDSDGSPAEAIAVRTVNNENGIWQYSTDSGTNWSAIISNTGSTFTFNPARLLSSTHLIRFVPDTDWTGSTYIQFHAWDKSSGTAGGTGDYTSNGGTTAYSSSTDSAYITVNATNNAPSFMINTTLTAVDENSTDPSGTTVSSLFDGQFIDADSGNIMAGIAVTTDAASSSSGDWQYSTDYGSNWYDLGSISTSQALLLNNTSQLRFVPATDYNGSVGALTVHAVDSSGSTTFTSGSSRQTFDTTGDDATSVISAAGIYLSSSINAVTSSSSSDDRSPKITATDNLVTEFKEKVSAQAEPSTTAPIAVVVMDETVQPTSITQISSINMDASMEDLKKSLETKSADTIIASLASNTAPGMQDTANFAKEMKPGATFNPGKLMKDLQGKNLPPEQIKSLILMIKEVNYKQNLELFKAGIEKSANVARDTKALLITDQLPDEYDDLDDIIIDIAGEDKVALLIGVEEYPNPNISKLATPLDDIDDIGKELKNNLGYKAFLLKDPTFQQMIKALFELRDKIKANQKLVVYFAGHGFTDRATNMGYWFLNDSSPNDPSKWIPTNYMLEMLNNTRSSKILLITDSCYPRFGVEDKSDKAELKAVTIMTSGDDEPVMDMDDDGSNHSPFANALITELKNLEDDSSITAMTERINKKVQEKWPQSPTSIVLDSGYSFEVEQKEASE
jgi:hypothetical protein